MESIAVLGKFTPEDLLGMPDAVEFELVDGNLVERKGGALSSRVGGQLRRLLVNHCHRAGLGWIFGPNCGFQCYPDAPDKVRQPDGAFIRRGRLPRERIPVGHNQISPDLAVEVVSPNETYYEVDWKIHEYLSAGVRLVWAVNPEIQSITICRPDRSMTWLSVEDELSGEDVVPGFRCAVKDLFPPPETGS